MAESQRIPHDEAGETWSEEKLRTLVTSGWIAAIDDMPEDDDAQWWKDFRAAQDRKYDELSQ